MRARCSPAPPAVPRPISWPVCGSRKCPRSSQMMSQSAVSSRMRVHVVGQQRLGEIFAELSFSLADHR